MIATIIADKDGQTTLFEKLKNFIIPYLEKKRLETEIIMVGRDDLAYCMGCFGCWIKKPGECVINDRMTEINQFYNCSDFVIYISPVVFGQVSANIKNALDRWLPNILPFFNTNSRGFTEHPWRYATHPKRILIGYADEIPDDDRQLFSDIPLKHQGSFEVLTYQKKDGENSFIQAFQSIEFESVGGKQG